MTSTAADSAREGARSPDGKFGVQPVSEAGDVDLAGSAGPDAPAPLTPGPKARSIPEPSWGWSTGVKEVLAERITKRGDFRSIDAVFVNGEHAGYAFGRDGEWERTETLDKPGIEDFTRGVYGKRRAQVLNDLASAYIRAKRDAEPAESANDEEGFRASPTSVIGGTAAPDVVRAEPMAITEAVGYATPEGRLRTTVLIDPEEFYSRPEEDEMGNSRLDYLAWRQMDHGEASDLDYTIVGTEPDGSMRVEVDNDLAQWLDNDGWGVESPLNESYKADIIDSYTENPKD